MFYNNRTLYHYDRIVGFSFGKTVFLKILSNFYQDARILYNHCMFFNVFAVVKEILLATIKSHKVEALPIPPPYR